MGRTRHDRRSPTADRLTDAQPSLASLPYSLWDDDRLDEGSAAAGPAGGRQGGRLHDALAPSVTAVPSVTSQPVGDAQPTDGHCVPRAAAALGS